MKKNAFFFFFIGISAIGLVGSSLVFSAIFCLRSEKQDACFFYYLVIIIINI